MNTAPITIYVLSGFALHFATISVTGTPDPPWTSRAGYASLLEGRSCPMVSMVGFAGDIYRLLHVCRLEVV